MTGQQRHDMTIASIRASIRFWEQRGMHSAAARAAALLQRLEAGGDQ